MNSRGLVLGNFLPWPFSLMLITANHGAGWSQPALKERAVPSLVTKGTAGSATQGLFLNLTGNDHHDQEMPTDKG